jgi:hypothetical protein
VSFDIGTYLTSKLIRLKFFNVNYLIIRPILKDIKKSLEGHIVLDCDADLLLTVFKQAKEVNLLDDYHSFIITSLVRINFIYD